ncbi:MAG: FAD-dependent oxidoreductase [Bryobacterales bacterium]|nr:FAD-dependent oxidoreductase [Bryobacterales bacterium]
MTAKLIRFVDLAPTIRHFVFSVPEVEALSFEPGHFASLTAPVNGKEITRAYSLAAAPRGDNQFEICLNRVDDGVFSPYLFSLQPGDTITLKGILGTFQWREPAMDAILVATGTGVVPFRAMLQDLFARGTDRKVALIYGTRHAESLLWLEEFRALEAAHSNFHFVPTVTRPGADWAGATGRVQPLLLDAMGSRVDVQVYVCGLKEMVDSVRALCKERGMERRQMIYEKYD